MSSAFWFGIAVGALAVIGMAALFAFWDYRNDRRKVSSWEIQDALFDTAVDGYQTYLPEGGKLETGYLQCLATLFGVEYQERVSSAGWRRWEHERLNRKAGTP